MGPSHQSCGEGLLTGIVDHSGEIGCVTACTTILSFRNAKGVPVSFRGADLGETRCGRLEPAQTKQSLVSVRCPSRAGVPGSPFEAGACPTSEERPALSAEHGRRAAESRCRRGLLHLAVASGRLVHLLREREERRQREARLGDVRGSDRGTSGGSSAEDRLRMHPGADKGLRVASQRSDS